MLSAALDEGTEKRRKAYGYRDGPDSLSFFLLSFDSFLLLSSGSIELVKEKKKKTLISYTSLLPPLSFQVPSFFEDVEGSNKNISMEADC